VVLESVDRLFVRVRAFPFFLRLTLFTRILLAAGFIPTGMVKLLDRRFTLLGAESPIGAFFEALYRSGMYWQFLGLAQVLAGVLVLVPRWAHLGAFLFLPIMVNIFVITVSLGFRGTPFVTGMMLLAVLYLCAWDYHRLRGLFTERPWDPRLDVPSPRLDRWERSGFWVFGVSLLMVFGATRSLVSLVDFRVFLMTGFAAGLFTLVRFLVVARRSSLRE
jgi:hypothetical protein